MSNNNRSQDLLETIHPEFKEVLLTSIAAVKPHQRFSSVTITDPGFVLAIGKNAVVQTKAFLESAEIEMLGIRIHQVEGYTDETLEDYPNAIQYLSHPIPNEKTFQFTRKTLELISDLEPNTKLYVLISGGGSAAFALPEPEIIPEKYLEIIRLAIAAGFDIDELNLIRSLIDQVKGGKFGAKMDHLRIQSYVTSDVVSDDPKIVASGPTVAPLDIDTHVTKWLSRLMINMEIPISIDELIQRLPSESLDHVENTVITTRMDLISVLQAKLDSLGFDTMIADASLTSSIEETVATITQLIDQFSSFTGRILIWSGEPTISLPSQAIQNGKGGRISAICCLLADELEDYADILFLGLATDGKDGSSPSSAYVVNNETKSHLRPLGGARALIRAGNSGLALSSMGYGFDLGNTDINLLDLYIGIIM